MAFHADDRELIATDISAYLDKQKSKELLRFITCGSVDDGKSTLIGRLLYESKQIFDDQMAALESDSKRHGTQGEKIDFALLVDGLSAEREQGITIDVAYRFFTSARRKFIVADTPGHEQYTRNMVTGASTADLAVLLVDARKGVLTQTRRHSYLAQLVGIRRFVLAVNKMREQDMVRTMPVTDFVAATSVGIVGGEPMLDLAYVEDSKADVDMNVVKTGAGLYIELQGTAEALPFGREALNRLLDLADTGIRQLIALQKGLVGQYLGKQT